jgi:hypothetical protein
MLLLVALRENGLFKNEMLSEIYQTYEIIQVCQNKIFHFSFNHTSYKHHKTTFFFTQVSLLHHAKLQSNTYYCIVLAET